MPSLLYKQTVTEQLARWGYTGLVSIVWLLSALVFLFKGTLKDKDYRDRKRQRLGFLPKSQTTGGLLVHCVSVGEVVAAMPLIRQIQSKHPGCAITITTTTPTGAAQVINTFGEQVQHRYLPYDLPIVMSALLRSVKPDKLLITEVELWPNLIHCCWLTAIPVYLINARLTDKSARNYAKIHKLFSPMVQKLTAVCAQGERDFNNYQRLGCNEQQLVLTNNIKFDLQFSQQDHDKAQALAALLNIANRPVLLGASTHDPEEKLLLECYQSLQSDFPDLLLLLTPRHPQRFSKVEKLIEQQALNYQKLVDNTPLLDSTQVLLVDEMGILKSVYALATIAFVGGSFANRGGHNALEAALVAKPIVMGPSRHNNPLICDTLIAAGALSAVSTETELEKQIRFWLENPDIAKQAGLAGAKVIEDNAGAITATLKVLAL